MTKDNEMILELDGKEKKYKIIMSFDIDDRHYIIYTDNTKDEDGFIKTYAGIYDSDGKEEKLLPVQTDEELELIESLLEKTLGEDET